MDLLEYILGKSNYWASIVLMMIGLHAMISKNNLIKKLIGMSVFQTAIILFYVSSSAKRGAKIPIIHPHGDHADKADHAAEAGHHAADAVHHAIDATAYENPLPHVLMLTAIVVGVATLGLALAMVQKVYAAYGSIEEDEVLAAIAEATANGASISMPSPSDSPAQGDVSPS